MPDAMRFHATMRRRRRVPAKRMMPPALTASLAMSLVLAVGCGESDQAKAEKTVCEAKTQIASSVKSLQGLTLSTTSISTVQSDVKSIGEGLKKIQGAQGQLNSTRREQLEKANSELSAELSSLSHELSSLTLTTAQTQITAAVNKLAASYKQALAPVEC
ncbi:MAG: hypothetical protein ACHQE6_08705 [Solirubrobacterales bacterium]